MRRDVGRSGAQGAEALLERLAGVYRDVDRALSGWSCSASTDCCRFGVTGREPYVTSIEVAALRRAIARRGGERALEAATGPSAKRRGLRMVDDEARERRCPLLGRDGRCTVYAWRPLGCRTFYCERAEPGGTSLSQADVNELVRRVQEIAVLHEPEGDRGRPLSRVSTFGKRGP